MTTTTTTIAPLTSFEQAGLDQAAQFLSSGDSGRAIGVLSGLLAANPRMSNAHHLLGAALYSRGQLEAAEKALLEAVRLAPNEVAPIVQLSELLVFTDRAVAARELLAPAVARPDANIFILTADAAALKSLRRFDEAAKTYERARDLTPKSAVAEHNLAGAYGDMQRYADSEQATQRAFSKGLDAPETWLVRARALQGLGRLDEADQAYREAIGRRPAYADAHGDLAQLVWMRTEDAASAGEALDAAVHANPRDVALRLKLSQLREYVGDARAAYAVLHEAPGEMRATPIVEAIAAQLAIHFDPALALEHARRAYDAAPDLQAAVTALCQAQLAAGDAEGAARSAMVLRARWSLNQHGIALLATAWRMLGVEGYHDLHDYPHFVRAQQIDTPEGWASLESYLDDLTEAVERSHRFRGHPIGQSLRQGGQSELAMRDSPSPAIRAFAQAIDGPIKRYIEQLGAGQDPLRARIGEGYALNGAWSVRLRPEGFHRDHVHQMGWISSACHIVTPASIDKGHEGWLKFGEPGTPTQPPLAAEHFIRPERGTLVLFPSYMWHGTVPFSGPGERLSLAFDLLPR